MSSLQEILGEDHFVQKYSYQKDIRFLQLPDQKVVVKPKKRYDLETVYRYLQDHHVTSYVSPLAIEKNEVLFPYCEDALLTADEKAKKMLYTLSIWQNKTTTHQRLDIDEVKARYEMYRKKIADTNLYYHNLQDMIETKVYMSPSEYLLVRNSSLIYAALAYSQQALEEWYQRIQQKKSKRQVYCHGKCELSHFLGSDNGYFISLENAHLGDVWEDFTCFYRQDFQQVDMISSFHFYQHKYPFTKEEQLALYVELSLPEIIDIYPSSLQKCQQLTKFIEYLMRTSEFLSEQQKKNQEH